MFRKKSLKDIIAVPSHIFLHIVIIAVSAGIAFSLPWTAGFLARKFLAYWDLVGNEEVFMVSVEIAAAVLLILFFSYAASVWKNRRRAATAREAGLVTLASSRGVFSRWRNRRQKESEGAARDIMVIGSTGNRTFVDSRGDLHKVIRNCRAAKILLLNPYSEGADIRARSILNPDITIEKFRDQIRQSIEFLKELRGVQKDIRLKLYDSVPFLKMAISGDIIWLKHYHAGLDVQGLPEYEFRHNQNPGSLYAMFYQYFLNQWNNPGIPEYDLETDELVYRDGPGSAERRERLGKAEEAAAVC